MRILMPCAAFPPFIDGGGPISALQIAHMLKKEGHDLRILHVSEEDRFEEFEGIPVKRMSSLNIYWNYYQPRPKLQKATWHLLENGNPRAFFAMRREMQDFRPDVVHTVSIENINVATWAAARSLGIPVAHTIHSAFLLTWKGVMQKAGKPLDRQTFPDRLTSMGKRFFSRYVDMVIGESNDVVQRHLKEGYFKNAIARCIPGAIPDDIAGHPRKYPVSRPFRIGFIAVHTAFKGIDVLAKAAANFPETPSVEFYIAGTGRDDFAEQARRAFPADKTTFLGWTKPEDFFPQIDLLVAPSIGAEAFGRVAVEAFAQAVPVIGTNLGGLSETIVPDVNGLHVPPGDSRAIGASMLEIASEPDRYETLSKGALASAPQYTATNVAAAYTNAFETIVERTHT